MLNSEIRKYSIDNEYEKLGEMGHVCMGLDRANIPYDLITRGFSNRYSPDIIDFEVESVSIVFPPVDNENLVVPIIDFNKDCEFVAARVENAYPLGYNFWDDEEDNWDMRDIGDGI